MIFKQHPIYKLTTQLNKHDAFQRKNFSRISVFYLKLLLQEPFRMWDEIRHSSAIHAHQLEKEPIFIIGHWRSGTSILQYLLGCDPQFGYLNKFEAVFPEVFLGSERFLKSLAQKIPQSFNLTKDARDMSINLEWDSPSEIEIALATMISPTSLHWGHIFPQQSDEYFNKYLFLTTASEAEITQWKRDYAHLIKKISLKNGGRQVLVKSPANTSRIKKLLELYPKARFIYLHRNPYDIFYSSQKLWRTLIDNLALQDFSQQQIEEKIVAVYKELLYHYMEQRLCIPEGQLVEIRFENFAARPLEHLFRIYDQMKINGFDDAEQHFRSLLEHEINLKSNRYDYDSDVIKWLNKEWQFAFDEWNYAMLSDVPYLYEDEFKAVG
jgi:hypothetical protein